VIFTWIEVCAQVNLRKRMVSFFARAEQEWPPLRWTVGLDPVATGLTDGGRD
jgi:hypothetical protein